MPSTAATAPFDLQDAHPLEMIPFFRRWPVGFWRDVIYTFIWNTLLALVFAAIALLFVHKAPLSRVLWLNLVFAQCVGYTIHALFAFALAAVPREHRSGGWRRPLFYCAVPIVGVVIGFWIGATVLGLAGYRFDAFSPRNVLAIVFTSLLISGVMLALFLPRERAAKAEAQVAREQARVAVAEREAALAQMQALAAQVEPHFLYNTLAHVETLIDAEPALAKRMLSRLSALLRAAAKGAGGAATLGSQLEHVRAYLDILALRMGPRLAWTVDVPEPLLGATVPPAVLQPLVENAVKHGLEPKIEGGTIAVSARERDGKLQIEVADTGAGFRATHTPIGGSTGLGLSGLKARLAVLHGDAASVTIAENQPAGVRVTVRLPMRSGT
jgi:signal transduction histidine kinase